jgi:hypothetical protein
MINPEDLNDNNSQYIGDGLYAHVNPVGIWVLACNGKEVTQEVCFENNSTVENFIRFNSKIRGVT